MVAPDELKRRLADGVAGCRHVEVTDLTGTGDHFQALVVAESFEGRTPVARHRLVYAALGELMAGPVHALTLETLTPDEHTRAAAAARPPGF